jgi:hypothetical protein
MSNERLGIFEELREKAERYAHQGEAIRRRIEGAGPVTKNGAFAQQVNPFSLGALRLRSRKGYHRREVPPTGGTRRRATWPEGHLGLNVVQVVQAVVLESGLTTGELMGLRRDRRVAWPRHVAMWAVDRYCPEYSLPEIAYMFRRDHTTVMHGIEATQVRLINGDAETKTLVANVRQRLAAIAEAAP